MQIPVKGGSAVWNASTVIMTSNQPIEEWYPFSKKDDIDALRRRIRIFEFPQEKWLAECWIKGEAPVIPSRGTWGGAVAEPSPIVLGDSDDEEILEELRRCT